MKLEPVGEAATSTATRGAASTPGFSDAIAVLQGLPGRSASETLSYCGTGSGLSITNASSCALIGLAHTWAPGAWPTPMHLPVPTFRSSPELTPRVKTVVLGGTAAKR